MKTLGNSQLILMVIVLVGVSCGSKKSPSVPFGILDDAGLARLHTICRPLDTKGRLDYTKLLPDGFATAISNPEHLVCGQDVGDVAGNSPQSRIGMVRDRATGRMIAMDIWIRSKNGDPRLTPAYISQLMEIAVDPWLKVMPPEEFRDFSLGLLSHKMPDRDGSGWAIVGSETSDADCKFLFTLSVGLKDNPATFGSLAEVGVDLVFDSSVSSPSVP